MDEKRKSETGTRPADESSKSGQIPQAGDNPTGQTPQGTGGGSTYPPGQQPSRADQDEAEKGKSTYQPGQGGKGGGGYQPGQSEMAGGTTSRPDNDS